MVDEKQVKEVFQVLDLEPNEEFSIISPGYGNLTLVKHAYISETLHLFDRGDGKMKDDYILNILRGILTVKKQAPPAERPKSESFFALRICLPRKGTKRKQGIWRRAAISRKTDKKPGYRCLQ